MAKGLIFLPIFAILALVALAPWVAAHSPLFPEENHSLATAKQIEDMEKSFAIYHELEAEEASYYKFEMKEGDRISLQLLTPDSPARTEFLPGLALLGPGILENDSLPAFVEVPSGYGKLVEQGDSTAEGELEPFTPGPIFDLARVDVLAPEDGLYYAVVFSGEVGGNYALAVGYVEGFTFEEIVLLPMNLILIYQWEGQELWEALLPYLSVFLLGGMAAIYGYTRVKRPSSLAQWAALISALAFFGSSASVLYQLAFSFMGVEPSFTVLLSISFMAIYLLLGILMARFAYRKAGRTAPVTRLILVAISLIGIALWGGIYIGPAFALLAALLPSKE